MNLLKAAGMALEVLTDYVEDPRCQKEIDEAAEALRQALAQQEHEPVAWIGKRRCQQLQEGAPVTTTLTSHKAFLDDVALYTAPPQKEWVGLTEQDVHDAFQFTELIKQLDWHRETPQWCESFAEYLEAKLKKKNSGA